MSKKRISKKLRQSIQEYLKILKADRLPIEEAVLFGSYAKGLQNKWSDVDLCIVSPAFKDSWEATQYLWQKIPRNFSLILEPIGYHPKDFKEGSSLISQIKKMGVRIV